MTTKQAHRLYLKLDREHVGVRIVCPGVDKGNCGMYSMSDTCFCTEDLDPDTQQARPCEACRAGEHGDCQGEWPVIYDQVGPGCHLEPSSNCGVEEYLQEIGIEDMLHGTEAEWRYTLGGAALAKVVWNDGYPELHPWAEEEGAGT